MHEVAGNTFIDVNEAFLRCTGRARAEVIGESLGELKMWLDPSLPSKLTRAVAESGTVSGIEAVFRRLDGELGYGLVSATRIEVRQVPCLLLVAVDITERKRAEEQLLLVKTSIDRAPHAAYWMDSSGNFVYANESGHVALGYTHEELLSLHVSQVNPRATSERWAEVYQMLKTSGPMTLVSQHRRKDGTILDVELTSAYLRNGDREYCLGFAVDITERLKAEREREQLQAQLLQAQKMESVGRLAGGVAHDFNNMLTVIQMSAQQGFERLTPTDPLYEDLRTISNAAKRSAALTKQLLAFARKQQIAPRVLDLNATIGGMLDMLRRLVGENLELDWHPGVGLWPVRIDPSQLDQLLANLCVNARDAIADVGTVWIETANRTLAAGSCFGATGRVSGDYVELAVRDNGCGMSETVQSHLFEPFYTTKGEGQGTGLGLATVYGIVSQNGGCIDVVSAPLQGTTFKVYLPRQHAKVATVHTEPPPRADVAKHTVLVVEDESAILNLIARQLGRVGYEVLCAQDPAEAIRAAQKHTSEVHLLLTDVVMPQMNGHELARALAALSPGIRCLFMSGYTADVIARHGVLDSEVAFIQKPFTSNELLAQVRSVLGMGSAP